MAQFICSPVTCLYRGKGGFEPGDLCRNRRLAYREIQNLVRRDNGPTVHQKKISGSYLADLDKDQDMAANVTNYGLAPISETIFVQIPPIVGILLIRR